jgi:hypothetical protein
MLRIAAGKLRWLCRAEQSLAVTRPPPTLARQRQHFSPASCPTLRPRLVALLALGAATPGTWKLDVFDIGGLRIPMDLY